MSLAAVTADEVRALFDTAKARVRGHSCLAAAAQALADVFYETYFASTVLVRVFATATFGSLPPGERRFVEAMLAREEPWAAAVEAETPVLCLLGTRGEQPQWNRRQDSRGHLAIPLLGPEFVAGIPMVARLLKELGVSLHGLGAGDPAAGPGLVSRTLGSLSSIFYVEAAGEARDEMGRHIIADQRFVADHGVRSVFGFGGAYMRERSFTAAIVFARESVPRASAERFAPLASVLKTATMQLVEQDRIFPA